MSNSVTREGNVYTISAGLVHTAIVAIVGSLLGLCGYMIVWAINDAAWKARVDDKMSHVEQQLRNQLGTLAKEQLYIRDKVDRGILPIAEEKYGTLDERVTRLEDWRADSQRSR